METPDDKGEYKVEINKKWGQDDKWEGEKPSSIKVDLFIVPLDKDEVYVKYNYGSDPNLFKYGEIEISEKNKWIGKFEDNYFNGADKQEILDRLGIESWTEIGLPEDAFSMDKGLPFTAEELAERGYKYLFVERGEGYSVEVEETLPEKDKEYENYPLEIERNRGIYPSYQSNNPEIYLFYQDNTGLGHLELLDHATLTDEKVILNNPILAEKITKMEYYGQERIFFEWGKDWDVVGPGYHIGDKGYAFILEDNGEGLTLKIPYLWSKNYEKEGEISGFIARQLEDKVTSILKGHKEHFVTITNNNYGKLDINKSWDSSIQERYP